ncbi:hypothetical protein IEQ34_021121 [Dendrobium chrysotoxum]|uniref:Uncharacterized protein n=1 Tax=Dendrobium chrysotoxum TaxID=161865 RepID=A0AAV7G3A3_DENCH|nr:hypothetical protein IEQ34_021121 [Dendrobium chrysotoxum]
MFCLLVVYLIVVLLISMNVVTAYQLILTVIISFVLVLNGNGADLAKHCISAFSYKRISITFRKMNKTKRPYNFKLDSNFQNIKSSNFSDASESCHTNKRMTL